MAKEKYFYDGTIKVIPKDSKEAGKIYRTLKTWADNDKHSELCLRPDCSESQSGILTAKFFGESETPLKGNVSKKFWSTFQALWDKELFENLDYLQSKDFNIIFEFSEYKENAEDYTHNIEIIKKNADQNKYWAAQTQTKELSLIDLMDNFGFGLSKAMKELSFGYHVPPTYKQVQKVLELVQLYSWLGRSYVDSIEDAEERLSILSENFCWNLDYIRKSTGLSIKENIQILNAINAIKKVLDSVDLDNDEMDRGMPYWMIMPEENFWAKSQHILYNALFEAFAFVSNIKNDKIQNAISAIDDFILDNVEDDDKQKARNYEAFLEDFLEILESIHGKEVE